ncbi:hypothetical protein niasHT_032394 [Heterodera trifolii]|uniref:Uncharacterized protein n=1 Tax=Heterodera trifolii TaxID=157864 RepID=A0ABD2HRA3_9BILA
MLFSFSMLDQPHNTNCISPTVTHQCEMILPIVESEVEELRQILYQMRQDGTASSASGRRMGAQKPQSPPSPPHPTAFVPATASTTVHHQQPMQAQQFRQNLMQTDSSVNETAVVPAQQFNSTGGPHQPNSNYNTHMLQLFLTHGGAGTAHSGSGGAQQQQHPPVPISAGGSAPGVAPSSAALSAVASTLGRMFDQLGAATAGSATNSNNNGTSNNVLQQQQQQQWGGEKQQQQLILSTIQMLQQAAQIQQNGQQQQQQTHGGSSSSTRNNSIQSGESAFFDPSSGIDVSETSSSASSTNTQMMLQSPSQLMDCAKPPSLPPIGTNLLAPHIHQQQHHQPQQITQQIVQHNAPAHPTLNRSQIEFLNAAISRTTNAAATHLLSPAHVVQQQQQQMGGQTPSSNCNTTSEMARKISTLSTLQTLLQLNLQHQSQQQQQPTPPQQQPHLVVQQRLQQHQQQNAIAVAAAAAKAQQQKAHKRIGGTQQQQQQQQRHAQQQFFGQSMGMLQMSDSFGQRHHAQSDGTALLSAAQQQHQHERAAHAPVERRRAASDDHIQSICSQTYTEEQIQRIQIPVAEAQNDPYFKPMSEQQVIQQVLQNKKHENQSVAETMAQLCKKLAEKRVFGSRLMAKTTFAMPNHSSYSNLPLPGIIYIYYVCQKVLFDRVGKENEFKEYFREAMRKLAARCRRVRHARKFHHKQPQGVELAPSVGVVVGQSPFQQFGGRPVVGPNAIAALGHQQQQQHSMTTSGAAAGPSAAMSGGGIGQSQDTAQTMAAVNAALAELAHRRQQQQQMALQSSLGNALELNELPPCSSGSGGSLLASMVENGGGISGGGLLNVAAAREAVERMEVEETHLDDEEEEEDLEEEEGHLSSPTISSQSTGTTTQQQSPEDGDGESSDACARSSGGDSGTTSGGMDEHHAPEQMDIKHEHSQEQLHQQPMDRSE